MPSDRIDFISEYCDRWCERCAFTERCSSFAVHTAMAMCDGDFEAALELAVGRPKSVTPGDDATPDWLSEIVDAVPTQAEIAEGVCREDARRARISQLPLSTLSEGVRTLCLEWLKHHGADARRNRSSAVREALQIVHWDLYLIGAKIYRALSGRDHAACGDDAEEDLVQNDWNGSAKVALMCIERSSDAWRVIARETDDRDARRLSDELQALRAELERVFPHARRFERPGFDAAR